MSDASPPTKRVAEHNPFDSAQRPWACVLNAGTSITILLCAVIAASILCVGAGGVGCEVLKALVLSGVKRVDVVRPNYVPCKRLRDCTHPHTYTPSAED
jgi:hypothetical protein